MGIIDKPSSFSQYTTTTEELPDNFLNVIADKIKSNAFQVIDEETAQERSAGWVNIFDMLDNKFDDIGFLKEPYIALSLRVDERKVPSEILKRYCMEEEKRIKATQNIDFLTKVRRDDIKEMVKLRLLKRVIPSSKTYDMIWNYGTGKLIFTSTNAKLCDEFQNKFVKTFDIETNSGHPAMTGSQILSDHNAPNNTVDTFTHFEHIGADFLTWLWHRVDTQKNSFVYNDQTAQLWFDEKVILQQGNSDNVETVTCIGDSQSMIEIKSALEEQKKIIQTKLVVITDSNEWSFTLDAAYLDFKSLKTPKVIQDKENPDGTFYEKIYLIEEIIEIINQIYTVFVLEYTDKMKG
jgi:hypothetical protein